MSNLVLIFVCLICGYLCKKTGRFPLATSQALNSFIVFISLPSLVLIQITKLFETTQFEWSLLKPISMPWIVFLLSWLIFSQLGKWKGWSEARTGALILIAGLGNTSFVGLPLLEATLGAESMPWGILLDQLGSFLALSTLGLFVASRHGRSRDGVERTPIKQMLSLPPFMALMIALILGTQKISFTGFSFDVLNRLSLTLVPLALFAVGFQLKLGLSSLKRYAKPLVLGLVFKLIVCPAIFFFYYSFTNTPLDLVTRVIILEAAMATMITSAVIVSEFSLDEELAHLMVGVSILISLVSVPAWNWMIQNFY